MNKRTTLTLTTLLLALPAVPQAAHVTHLRCEYRENSLGIELVKPQLGWLIEGGGRESNVTVTLRANHGKSGALDFAIISGLS